MKQAGYQTEMSNKACSPWWYAYNS